MKCINCGAEANHWHHVVPKSLGGQEGTNRVPLCDKCHGLIHGVTYSNGTISHSDLTKQGLKRARAEGKQIGQRKGAKLTTKKSVMAKEIIKKYSKDFEGTLEDADVIKLAEVCRNTYYKYKSELKIINE